MAFQTQTPTVTRHTARPIPVAALQQLRRSDDTGRPMRPFVASESAQPIASIGSPLRCCLRPIEVGERVALVSYAPLRRWAAEHDADPGAYDECGPVFIHADPCSGPELDPARHPHTRRGALRTVRRYDRRGVIVGGRLVELGEDPTATLEAAFTDAFDDPAVELVHVRAVEYGCFHFELRRSPN